MNEDYRNPEWENLPPFKAHQKGFCVRVLDKVGNGWLRKNKWYTVFNSYGHAWVYKGFAINCAIGWIYRWRHHATKNTAGLYTCVVDLSNEEVVWCSWRDYEKR